MEKQSPVRGPLHAPRLTPNLPIKWDREAHALGYNNDIIRQFVSHVASRVVAMDPSSQFVVRRHSDMECGGHYLAPLLLRTTLSAAACEGLLDDAAAEALDIFGVPNIPVVAAME